ncbi:MAG: alpha-ketoglutarate-dependent dioxygenase AlkB [Actinomycetota bacterium]
MPSTAVLRPPGAVARPAAAPSVIAQPSLLGLGAPTFDHTFAGIERLELERNAWIDHLPGWLDGHQVVFDELAAAVGWEQHQRPMYERMVDVPRLTGGLPDAMTGEVSSVIDGMAAALGERYGSVFERIGLGFYRNGADSVAWHGDMVARNLHQALVATVSVGEPRPFRLRPKNGGESIEFRLGHGDLVVMGGTCQRTWDHCVPKVARAGPRIAIMFRPLWPGLPQA